MDREEALPSCHRCGLFFNNQIDFLPSWLLATPRYHAGMDSSAITRNQAERFRQQIQRNLHYMNSLCRRMEKLAYPANDPLFEAAMKARHAVQALYVQAHYAGCTSGVGKATPARPLQPPPRL